MAKTREIKKRIKAVGNIRRITKTMQMIATAKFSASQTRSLAGKPYTQAIFELVAELAKSVGSEVSHPLLGSDQKPGGKDLTLILTTDRGLCGPYNGSVLRTAMALLRSTPSAKGGLVELVGKKGAGFLKFVGVTVSHQHTQFGDKPTYENVEALADEYIRRFSSGELSTVRIVYMRFITAGKQVPTVLQLLPFKADALPAPAAGAGKAAAPATPAPAKSPFNPVYEFSPDAASLLGELLPAAVKAVLFQSFNDAVVSEHISRMVAMKAATDNAGKMGKRLTRVFNRVRQAQITTELTEIISGAAALG